MTLLVDLAVATGLALIFLLMTWLYGRVLSGGRPLNAFKKRVLGYTFMFALGMVYLMAFVSGLHWPKELLFPAIGGWGCVVGFLAWWRYRREKRNAERGSQHPQSGLLGR